jgi:hypothetical protein
MFSGGNVGLLFTRVFTKCAAVVRTDPGTRGPLIRRAGRVVGAGFRTSIGFMHTHTQCYPHHEIMTPLITLLYGNGEENTCSKAIFGDSKTEASSIP